MKTLLFLMTLVIALPALSADLAIDIKNIRSDRGNIKVAIFNGAQGFPSDNRKAYAVRIIEINNKTAATVFKDLPAGEYAVGIFHDRNNNNRLDTRFRIPREPFGFSNNPRILGKPKFSTCKFTLGEDKDITIFLKELF